jgi:hypothetical protein
MPGTGPYALTRALGTCPAGGVWAASDAAGTQVTIAVLDTAVAADPEWRRVFAAMVDALARTSGLVAVGADFGGETPWVAYPATAVAGAEAVFISLGQNYQPVAATPPISGSPGSPPSGSSPPFSGSPGSPPYPGSPGSPPYSGSPAGSSGSPWPAEPAGAPAPSVGTRPNPFRWLGVIALLLLLPGAGTAIIAATAQPREPVPTPSRTPGVSAAPTASAEPFVTASPSQPGVEPPQDGGWPASWPKFGPADKASTVRLAGIGFPLQLPGTWHCTVQRRATGFAWYACTEPGNPAGITGDLLERACPSPCDSARRAEFRMAEEAWGQRWVRAGTFTTWAETGQVAGASRYGLVFVTFWRSRSDGPVDREFVFRVTAPPDRADEVRKVANSARQAIPG